MKRTIVYMMGVIVICLTGFGILYWLRPNIIIKISPFTFVAYSAFLKSSDDKEWENRMRNRYATDYNWLIDHLTDLSDDRPRFISAWSLGVMGNKDAIPKLIDRLENDPNIQVRYTSARALGDLNARDAIPNLIKSINDRDTTVRNVAVDILGNLNAKEAIPEIIKAKTNYQYPSMEYSATMALNKLQ